MEPHQLFSLKDKLILITGASSGIGRQCAITCSQMGARIALLGRDQLKMEETLGFMKNQQSHSLFSVDIQDDKDVVITIKEVITKMGLIDGLINCAGISTTLPINAISVQKMEQFFQTNVIGTLNITKQVVKQNHFSKEGGSIIFLSSVMGVVGEKGKILYSATKGALLAAVKSMAVELSPRKIRINAISPGVVETPMSQKSVYSKDDESLNRIKQLHPLGLGKPEDIANACVFILSDEARWITGTNMIIDGGYLAR